MRKILLGAFALFAAVAVNAQEFGYADSQEFSDALDMGGVVDATCLLHEGDNVTWSVGADTWKSGGASFRFTVNDDTENVQKSNGATGSNNPTVGADQSGQGAPTGGAYFIFDVKTDGYIYVLAKVNTNKNYLVWEEGDRIPYYWGAYDSTYGLVSYNLYDYADLLDYNADLDEYFINEDVKLDKPYVYLVDEGLIPDPGEGNSYAADCTMAVIKFQVWAGCQYNFCGTGTKCSVGGYYFDTTGDATITYVEVSEDDSSVITASHVLCDASNVTNSSAAGEAGISNITVAPTTENSAIYNLAGQRLSSMSKGINIVNGQKILIK
ncbi:MAG: hypothetical protein LUD48_05955 [Prevotella sp.]|nr:hypothetical protein [Prevotella sp.]